MSKIEVIGLGALNVDNIYKVERILEDGETMVSEAASFPGGSAANTIYGLAKLGIGSGFIGAVGDDAEGNILLNDFQETGVDTSRIRVKSKAKTGSVFCLSDRQGRRSLYVMPGANNLLNMDDLELAYINRAKMLHISSFADDVQLEMLIELIERLDSSVKLSFAPGALYSVKGLRALSPILARTHILFINQDEIKRLTGQGVRAGAEICLKQGCRIVTVTLGKGVRLELSGGTPRETVDAVGYVRNDDEEHVIEAATHNIISASDTIGAGDAFATGFLYGFFNGKGLEECGRLGNIVAQFSITRIGARQGLPALNELAQRYRQTYNKQL